MSLDDQGVYGVLGEGEGGGEAYDAASYDEYWDVRFGGHGVFVM